MVIAGGFQKMLQKVVIKNNKQTQVVISICDTQKVISPYVLYGFRNI